MAGLKSVVSVLFVTAIAVALPVQDVEIVESTIREVRAAAPEDLLFAETNYEHNHGADEEDSVGYLKRSENGGSDGYKHLDSYHKKDGDKYEFEKHSSFGKADKAAQEAGPTKEEGESSGYKVAEELNEGHEGEGYDSGAEGESEHYTEGEGHDSEYDFDSAKYSAAEESEGHEEDY